MYGFSRMSLLSEKLEILHNEKGEMMKAKNIQEPSLPMGERFPSKGRKLTRYSGRVSTVFPE
jgi:hypothetical protein